MVFNQHIYVLYPHEYKNKLKNRNDIISYIHTYFESMFAPNKAVVEKRNNVKQQQKKTPLHSNEYGT